MGILPELFDMPVELDGAIGEGYQQPQVDDNEEDKEKGAGKPENPFDEKASKEVQNKQPRDSKGRFGSGGGGGSGTSRAERAKATHKPTTAEKQRRGEAEQAKLAKEISGKNTDDNLAFDIIKGNHAIEVKTLIDNANKKITMHPRSRRRKLKEAKQQKLEAHTVVIDVSSSDHKMYYKKSVGSFRISAMEQISVTQLKEKLLL